MFLNLHLFRNHSRVRSSPHSSPIVQIRSWILSHLGQGFGQDLTGCPAIAGLARASSQAVQVNAYRCTKVEKDIIFYPGPGLMLFGAITIS